AGGLGMAAIGGGRSPRDEGAPEDPPRVSLDDLLRRSDVVSIHLPLNDETRGLFNEERLAKMKPGSWLLNTSRGPIVEEGALVQALESGHLAGAGLDGFGGEPAVHPGLLASGRAVLMPHARSATHE